MKTISFVSNKGNILISILIYTENNIIDKPIKATLYNENNNCFWQISRVYANSIKGNTLEEALNAYKVYEEKLINGNK